MDAHLPTDSHELEKRDAALLAGLRAALAGDEHRLYRSGKLDGLFPVKTGPVGHTLEVGVITVTNDILAKLPLIGKDLAEYSLDTVKMFRNDAVSAGFQIVTK